jgi:phage gp36-like protein
MNNFIDIKDYDATVHRDILDSLTRQDDAIIEICEDRAVAEMKSYLAKRFDTNTIFAATGSDRHPLVLMFALDISVYHIFCVHNPQKLSQNRKDRYDRAVTWLKDVVRPSDPLPVEGLPLKSEAEITKQMPYAMTSNPKRINHY